LFFFEFWVCFSRERDVPLMFYILAKLPRFVNTFGDYLKNIFHLSTCVLPLFIRVLRVFVILNAFFEKIL
jgi:hypothetical protein